MKILLAPLLTTAPLSEPPLQANPFLAANAWIESTLLGSIATAVAVIAVAVVGMMLLTGHLHARRGLTVLAGCFLLFGATTIADGIRVAMGGGDRRAAPDTPPSQPEPPSPLMAIATPTPVPPPAPYDPYAGAAVPQRR